MSTVTVANIVTAVDEALDATQCAGRENCHDDRRCMTHDLWANLNVKMIEYLESVSVHDLVTKQRQKVAIMHDNRAKGARTVAVMPS
jgi:Rrf2 family iron-sulfur cluster assembly transcriptional regulator